VRADRSVHNAAQTLAARCWADAGRAARGAGERRRWRTR
jgi:hypothetical protein